jgi:hypothetical protein
MPLYLVGVVVEENLVSNRSEVEVLGIQGMDRKTPFVHQIWRRPKKEAALADAMQASGLTLFAVLVQLPLSDLVSNFVLPHTGR